VVDSNLERLPSFEEPVTVSPLLMVGRSVEEVLMMELSEEWLGIGLARETGWVGRLEGASHELWIHLEVGETEAVVDKRRSNWDQDPRCSIYFLSLLQRPAPMAAPRRPCASASSGPNLVPRPARYINGTEPMPP